MPERTNEVAILKKCLKGDTKAFEPIVTKYQHLVCAITYSGVPDIHRSEELAQQTFINAWNKLAQLKDLSKFRPWLCTIARNLVISFKRTQKRDIIAKAKPMENINDTPADQSDPLESAIKKEHEELVSDTIRNIPEKYREPLVLFYRQQLSVKQIAQSLDLSEEIAKKRLQRGRKMIKEQLNSIFEQTLSATAPKKAFTTAVMASVAGIALKGTGAAATAAVITTNTASTATTTGTSITTIMSTLSAKIITAVALTAIGIGAAVTYTQNTKPKTEPQFPKTKTIATHQEKQIEETMPLTSGKTENIADTGVTESNLETKESSGSTTEVIQSKGNNNPAISEADSVEAKSDDKLIVGGFIKNQDGEPIAGVEVRLLWDVIRSMPMLGTSDAVTDHNGRWQCQITGESEDISIRLKHPEYVPQNNYRPAFEDLIEKSAVLIMKKGLQIAGYVHDTQGRPVPDALIMPPRSITSTSAEFGIQDSPNTVRTDADGVFLLKAVKSGLQGIVIDAPGYAPAFVRVNVTEELPPVEVILDHGHNLSGVVVDINNNPLSGVKVKIDQWEPIEKKDPNSINSHRMVHILRRKTVTDAKGKYLIEHLPSAGYVEVHFIKRPHLLSTYIKNYMDQSKTKNVTMYPIPTITGTVIDADSGKPITEFEVDAGCSWDPNYTVIKNYNTKKITSPEGHFSKTKSNFSAHELPLLGWVAVRISAKGYHSAQSPWMRIDQEFSPITISLKKPKTLSSTLLYSDGTAVANADVIILKPSARAYVNNGKIDASPEDYSVIQTDTKGYFEFTEPASPTTILVLGHDEYLVAKTNNLTDTLTMTPWAYVTGLLDRGDKNNSNIRIQIAPEHDYNDQIIWLAAQRTNADGFFEFFNIPAIPQKTYYGPVDNNKLNEGPDINPRPDQTIELILGQSQSEKN